jgi:hypothetical protein
LKHHNRWVEFHMVSIEAFLQGHYGVAVYASVHQICSRGKKSIRMVGPNLAIVLPIITTGFGTAVPCVVAVVAALTATTAKKAAKPIRNRRNSLIGAQIKY